MFGNQQDQAAASLPASRQVGTFTVHKLKLNAYLELFKRVKELPTHVVKILDGNMDNDHILAKLPEIIEVALPEIIELLAIVTKEDAKKLGDEMDLDTAVDVAIAAIELNNFLGVWRKLQSLPEKMKAVK